MQAPLPGGFRPRAGRPARRGDPPAGRGLRARCADRGSPAAGRRPRAQRDARARAAARSHPLRARSAGRAAGRRYGPQRVGRSRQPQSHAGALRRDLDLRRSGRDRSGSRVRGFRFGAGTSALHRLSRPAPASRVRARPDRLTADEPAGQARAVPRRRRERRRRAGRGVRPGRPPPRHHRCGRDRTLHAAGDRAVPARDRAPAPRLRGARIRPRRHRADRPCRPRHRHGRLQHRL